MLIHKLEKTAEAVFDYEECLELGKIPFREIKQEVEEYLSILEERGKIGHKYYFEIKYLDEETDTLLSLYLYKAQKLGLMQLWDLAGIAIYGSWTIEDEEDGLVRNWLKAKVTPDESEEDWVVTLKLWQEQQQKIMEEIQKEYEDGHKKAIR